MSKEQSEWMARTQSEMFIVLSLLTEKVRPISWCGAATTDRLLVVEGLRQVQPEDEQHGEKSSGP